MPAATTAISCTADELGAFDKLEQAGGNQPSSFMENGHELEPGMTRDRPLPKSFAGWITRFGMAVKVETLLITIAGFMAVTTAISSYRSAHAHWYQLMVIDSMKSDVINLCCISLAVVGVFNICVGLFKAAQRHSMSFNQYVGIVVCTLVANFCIGMMLTDFKTKVLQDLEPAMLKQMKELAATKAQFGVGFSLSDAWDFMQLKMTCCGVNGYRDYVELEKSNHFKNQLVPISCCGMKLPSSKLTVESSLAVPENLNQCQLDAKLMVVNSMFLNTEGCLSPLSRWTVRMINKMLVMVFCMICLQALGVFYLSWIGFRRAATMQHFNH